MQDSEYSAVSWLLDKPVLLDWAYRLCAIGLPLLGFGVAGVAWRRFRERQEIVGLIAEDYQ